MVPTVEIPGTIGLDVKRDNNGVRGMGDPDNAGFNLTSRTAGSINDVGGKPVFFQSVNQFKHGLKAASGRGPPYRLPSGSSGDLGDDMSILAPGDHDPRFVGAIRLKMTDGPEEMLMPGAQEDRSALFMIFFPDCFIFNLEPERPGVDTDKQIKESQKWRRCYESIYYI